MGRRAKLADRPPPRDMGRGRWFDTPAERRADATGRPNSCQSWALSISRGRRQCLSLNFRYRPRSRPSGSTPRTSHQSLIETLPASSQIGRVGWTAHAERCVAKKPATTIRSRRLGPEVDQRVPIHPDVERTRSGILCARLRTGACTPAQRSRTATGPSSAVPSIKRTFKEEFR